ncbi:MAG: M20 family metallopeptidase [Lactobacillus sp.]|nr:M20 family metallopeptidase [Lactobacillus sp.]
MDIIKTAQDLIRFKTETGNTEEIAKCLGYVKTLFENKNANVEVFERDNLAPVIMLSNTTEQDLDVAILGHLDVVPAEEHMFEPRIDNGKMYGRGTLDMKSFAAVALNSLEHVLDNSLNLKFAVILSTDEEKGSKGMHAFMEAHPDLNAKIVLDNDVGGDILKIINACKNPVFVKLIAKGLEAHGSTPWDGIDANEKLMQIWANIRKIYPYFSKDSGGAPQDTWIDTVHFAKIGGGSVANIICNEAEALLDFRLVETSSVEGLKDNLNKCMVDGVSYVIASESSTVVMKKDDPYIVDYKNFAEEILGQKIEFEQIGGATDSRSFAVRGSTVIMHSGTGEGMHAAGEYVEVASVLKIGEIQIKFLDKLSGQ